MTDYIRLNATEIDPIIDPETGGLLSVFSDALGQDGRPYIVRVSDPPNTSRPRHHHHGDVTYLYTAGEHHIEGEGTYRAGDVRWVRQGHTYGPETTGPEGGTWWIITNANPIPITQQLPTAAIGTSPEAIARRPSKTPIGELVELTTHAGAVIVEGLLSDADLEAINAEVDAWFHTYPDTGLPKSGSDLYDLFLGKRTLRLQGLTEKLPTWAPKLIAHPTLVEWADQCLANTTTGAVLNAGEFIQIGPNEPAQYLHRDTDSWPDLARRDTPVLVNAIIALDDFTLTNGATHLAQHSHLWAEGRQPSRAEQGRAVMNAGDAVLFRGDLLHGGGANHTDQRRRGLSLSYCAGWMRTVEAHHRNIPRQRLESFPALLRRLLVDDVHDMTARNGGILGLVDNGR